MTGNDISKMFDFKLYCYKPIPQFWPSFSDTYFKDHYIYNLRRKFNLTYDEIEAIWDNSFARCVVCEEVFIHPDDYDDDDRPYSAPCMHHNHATPNDPSGFTHHYCNSSLFPFENEISYLLVEIYLRETQRSYLLDDPDAEMTLVYTDKTQPSTNTTLETDDSDFSYIYNDEHSPYRDFNLAYQQIKFDLDYSEGLRAFDENSTPSKIYYLKYNYNLTSDEYLDLYIRQNFRCACCRNTVIPFTACAHVDECHVTNTNLAILCLTCNARRLPIYENGYGQRGKA